MTQQKQTKGPCTFCGREMTRSGMSNHLQTCPQRQTAITTAAETNPDDKHPLYHLLAYDAYATDFWLHLEMKGSATLTQLDRYLRAIWLECCGHLSEFSIGGWNGQKIGKSRKIESVFTAGVTLTHIYDFGTPSTTQIKFVAMREGQPLSKHPLYLLARNNMPEAVCAECGETAGWYCVDCLIEHDKWINLCADHLDGHDHDNYGGTVPLINSPRLGLCGYTGPAEPPY